MSCKNLNTTVDKCFEVEEQTCSKGCDPVVTTDCIFHDVKGPAAKLYNLGVLEGSSLTYILKQIDKRLELMLTTDFSSFNMYGLSNDISTIKEFVEMITKKVTEQETQIKISNINLEDAVKDIADLVDVLDGVIEIGLSSSKLGINTTDDINAVIKKLVGYLENFTAVNTISFDNSNSISYSKVGSKVLSEVKLSEVSGQTLQILDDGLYTANPSVTGILNAIKDNPELTTIFKSLISFPPFKFDIMSDENRPIKYVNEQGDTVTATARANTLLKLTDVKEIITSPITGLTITFKGI